MALWQWMKKKIQSCIFSHVVYSYVETVSQTPTGKKKNLLSVDCCSEFVTVFALWKSFALLHIISKDLWIMQWTESVLFQNYLTLHQNDIWAKCSLSTAVRVQMKFFTYKPKTLCGWKKYYIFYEAEIPCVMMKIE